MIATTAIPLDLPLPGGDFARLVPGSYADGCPTYTAPDGTTFQPDVVIPDDLAGWVDWSGDMLVLLYAPNIRVAPGTYAPPGTPGATREDLWTVARQFVAGEMAYRAAVAERQAEAERKAAEAQAKAARRAGRAKCKAEQAAQPTQMELLL